MNWSVLMVEDSLLPAYSAALRKYDRPPTFSAQVPLTLLLFDCGERTAPTRMSRCGFVTSFRKTMLSVPAIDCIEYSALAERMISMRSIWSGARASSENPGGGRSPLTNICV